IVDSPHVRCDGDEIETKFIYRKNHFTRTADGLKVIPKEHEYLFKTQLKPKKTGLLLVGLGGNNGSTSVGAIFANKKHMTWRTKEGEIIPILSPDDLIIDGWDINNKNLYEAMLRAKVFEPELQEKLRPYMEPIVPMPSIYYPDFIAANQGDRVNNIIPGKNKQQHLEHIRQDIRNFKQKHDLECVIVLWTANTERYTDVLDGLNMTADQILASIAA
ncbi:unnamed protein product, partial [Cylicostephanus goldi]